MAKACGECQERAGSTEFDMGGVCEERPEGLEYRQRASYGQGCVEACYPCARAIVGCEILWVSPLAYPNLFRTKGFVVIVVLKDGSEFKQADQVKHK